MKAQRGALKSFELFCTMCDWTVTVSPAEVVNWHLKKCPKCGKTVIVTDDDMNNYRRIIEDNLRRFGHEQGGV